MPVAWFDIPGKRIEGMPYPARGCPLEIDKGYWDCVEIDEDRFLTKVRAPKAVLSDIPYKKVKDPEVVWTTHRRKPFNASGEIGFGQHVPTSPLDLLNAQVPDDKEFDGLRKQAEGFMRTADTGLVVLLPDHLTQVQKNVVLTWVGNKGYSLAQIRPGTFPTTSLLDNFDRADGGLGGNWSTDPYGVGNTAPQIATNVVKWIGAGAGGEAWWNPNIFGPDSEVGLVISTLGNSEHTLNTRIQGGIGTTNADGYAQYHNTSNTNYQLGRLDNSVFTNLGATIAQVMAAGDSSGTEMIGSNISAYFKAAAGSWTNLGTRSDATYPGAGNIGFFISNNATIRINDFFGGTIGGPLIFAPLQQPVMTGLSW